MARTKVLVVDDSLTMRALLCGALERVPGVEIVGLADGAAEAREMVQSLKPEVMTLDIEMPGMSGLEYLKEIMENNRMDHISKRETQLGANCSDAEGLRTMFAEYGYIMCPLTGASFRIGDCLSRHINVH